jgi:ABC-type multidrug transport system ATPase subunit
VFGRIIVEMPYVLVLDEPTNHLDLEAISALVEGLRAFPGTVLFVSHDRWFVSQLATRILELRETGPQDFPGTYEEYLARSGDDHLDAEAVALREKTEKAAVATSSATPSLSWEEQKRRKNRKAKLPTLRDQALAAIDAAETRRAAIRTQWGDPNFYLSTKNADIAELEREERELAGRIEQLTAEWEALELELECLSGS